MGEAEEYLLKWNSHHTEITAEFLDSCRNEEFTDVTLTVGSSERSQQSFEVHKLILSACSPYFKQLLRRSPCRHPVIYLDDIEPEHMAMLLRYMYLGQIPVVKKDLDNVLKTAEQLRIKGLWTPDQTKSASEGSEVKLASATVISDKYEDNDRRIIPVTTGAGHVNEEVPVTGPSGSRVPQQHPTEPSLPGPSGLSHQQQQRPGSSGASGNGRGSHRKGYLPKKLRMSGDSEASARSSLSALITAASSPSVYPSLQEMSPGNGDGSSGDRITPETDPQEGTSRKSNATDATAEDRLMIVDEDEHEDGSGPSDADQPVDFSAGSSGSGAYKPRYSILSNYLKNGKKRTKSMGQLLERPSTSESEAAGSGSHEEAMAKAAESFAQSWLDQSLPLGLPNQQSSPEGDGSSSTRVAGTSQARETANLRDALGIDIAGQLRKHFLAAMQSPSQAAAAAAASMAAASNLAWLSNAAGTSGTASAAQMQAAAAALAASTASPPGVASAPSTSQAVTAEAAATLSSGRPVAEAPGSAAAAAAQAAAQAAAAQSAAGVEDAAGCSRQANGRISPRIDPRTGKQIVQCEICHKILADPSSLYRHRKIHSGDKPHQCPFCDRRFIQRYNMKQHIKTHRNEPMTPEQRAMLLPKVRGSSGQRGRLPRSAPRLEIPPLPLDAAAV